MKVVLEFDKIDENTFTEIIGLKQRLGLLYDIIVRLPKKECDKYPKIEGITPKFFMGFPLEIKE